MSPQGSLNVDDDWSRLPLAFAEGSPVLVIGPGCDRVGYDAEQSTAWQEVTRRVRLLHRAAGDEAKLFLEALWESKLSDATLDLKARARGLPEYLNLADGEVKYHDNEPLDTIRIESSRRAHLGGADQVYADTRRRDRERDGPRHHVGVGHPSPR